MMTTPDKDKVAGTSAAKASPGSSSSPSSEPAAKEAARRGPDPKEPGVPGAPTPAGPDVRAKARVRGRAPGKEGGAPAQAAAGAPAAAGEAPGTAGAADSAEEGSAAQDAPATDSELVAKAQAEAAEWQDKCMRLHAEWDTYRRRTTEQRGEERARAAEALVESLLPVIDDFERTIDYAQKNGETGLLGGVEAVHAKLVATLTGSGVEILDPQGEAFNALEAQAVASVDDAAQPDETVAEVYQKGYKMGRKVLRPAMVTVTTGGPKRKAPDESETKK